MKNLLLKTKRRLLLVFALLLALGIGTQVQAQIIHEGFEEAEWATTATGSHTKFVTISAYCTTGSNSTYNTGVWKYLGAILTSGTGSKRINTVYGGQRSMGLISTGTSMIVTPIITSGVTSVSFYMNGSSNNPAATLWVNTKTSMGAETNTVLVFATGTGTGTSHAPALGWTQIATFSLTGFSTNTATNFVQQSYDFPASLTGIPIILRIHRATNPIIDDIIITTPETTIKLSTPSVAAGPTTATNQGFTAQWADVSNESSYTVKVYKSSDNSLAKTESGIAANETSKVITGLSANTSYYYKVTAIGDGTTYSDSDPSAASSNIRTLSTAKAITAFTIAGIEADIDGTDITAQIPYSASWTQTPDVTVSEYADYSPKTAQDFSVPVEYTVTAEDGSYQVYTVIVTKANQSDACEMISFSIPGQISSAIDGTAITVVMPHGTDVTNLTPTVEVSLAASYVSDPEDTKDFTNPVTYYVISESESEYNEYYVTVQIAEPSITACPGPYDFNVTGWTASTSQTCSVSGSNLVADISVSVDAPFEVSNNNSTWSTTTTFTKTGFTASGTLYVRYNPTSGNGDDTGTVTLSSEGADNKSFTVNGTANPAISSPSNKTQTVVQNVAISDIVFTLSGAATTATLSGSLPSGITYNSTTNTISGSSLERGEFNYTLTTDGNPEAEVSGTIIIKGDLGGDATGKIAYVTTPTVPTQDTRILPYLQGNANYQVTVVSIANVPTTLTEVNTYFASYDLVILAEAPSTRDYLANMNAMKGMSKPFLNFKAFMYTVSDRWGWGAPNNGTSDYTARVTDKTHPIFNGLTFSGANNDEITLMSSSVGTLTSKGLNNVTGVSIGTMLAYTENNTGQLCIHEINEEDINASSGKYLMIAYNNESFGGVTDDGLLLVRNSINYLLGGGREHSTYDYYRTKEDGTWGEKTVWESSQDGNANWGEVSLSPTANATAVQIANRVTVSDGQSATVDKVKIDPVGKLIVEGSLTIGDTLTFVVNESGVSQVLNNGAITNNGVIKVRKTIKASNGWGFVSFPFNVAADKIFIAGTSTPATWGDLTDDGKDFYVAEYDAASRAAGNFNATNSPNWISVTPHVLVANKGYIMAVDNDITLDFISSTGEADLFETSAQVSVAKHPAVFPSNQDWNLIGVPFASSYELANASAEHAPYYCHNGATYSTVMPEDTYEASPFTAFFLQAYGAPEVVSFASNGRLVKAATVKDFSEIALVVKNAKYSDMTRIRLQEGASAAYELGKDAVKFFSNKLGVPQIASKLGALALSVNSVPANTTQVEVTVTITEDGTYTISLDGAAEGCEQIILVDGEVETDLLANEYSFAGTAGSTKNMSVLLVTEDTNVAVGTVEGGSILIQTIGDKAYISGLDGAAVVNVYDVAGKLVQRFTNVNNGDALTLNNAGVAIIEVKTATQNAKAKVSVKK